MYSLLSDPPGVGLSKAAVLKDRCGRTDVGGSTAGRAQVTLVQQLEQLFLSGAAGIWGEKEAFIKT